MFHETFDRKQFQITYETTVRIYWDKYKLIKYNLINKFEGKRQQLFSLKFNLNLLVYDRKTAICTMILLKTHA